MCHTWSACRLRPTDIFRFTYGHYHSYNKRNIKLNRAISQIKTQPCYKCCIQIAQIVSKSSPLKLRTCHIIILEFWGKYVYFCQTSTIFEIIQNRASMYESWDVRRVNDYHWNDTCISGYYTKKSINDEHKRESPVVTASELRWQPAGRHLHANVCSLHQSLEISYIPGIRRVDLRSSELKSLHNVSAIILKVCILVKKNPSVWH